MLIINTFKVFKSETRGGHAPDPGQAEAGRVGQGQLQVSPRFQHLSSFHLNYLTILICLSCRSPAFRLPNVKYNKDSQFLCLSVYIYAYTRQGNT